MISRVYLYGTQEDQYTVYRLLPVFNDNIIRLIVTCVGSHKQVDLPEGGTPAGQISYTIRAQVTPPTHTHTHQGYPII